MVSVWWYRWSFGVEVHGRVDSIIMLLNAVCNVYFFLSTFVEWQWALSFWLFETGSLVSTEDEHNAEEFVEIGTIAETHGLYGELRVRSLTDFPEERFETVRIFLDATLLTTWLPVFASDLFQVLVLDPRIEHLWSGQYCNAFVVDIIATIWKHANCKCKELLICSKIQHQQVLSCLVLKYITKVLSSVLNMCLSM